jgi:hypothetical protein
MKQKGASWSISLISLMNTDFFEITSVKIPACRSPAARAFGGGTQVGVQSVSTRSVCHRLSAWNLRLAFEIFAF